MNTSSLMKRWQQNLRALRRTPPPVRRSTAWTWGADAVLALVLTIGTLAAALSRGDSTETIDSPTVPSGGTPGLPSAPSAPAGAVLHHYGSALSWQVALAFLAAAPLLARRRYPLSVLWTVLVAGELFHLSAGFDATATFLACLIAAYSAVLHSPHRVAALASALIGTVVLVATHKQDAPTLQPGMAAFLLLLPIAIVGHAVYTWSRQTQALEKEQKEATRQAVTQERARIARELHDVITHHVSVMVVQTGAARKIMKMAPEEAEEMLLAIESSGRSAMTELRHAMDLLTLGDAEDLSDDSDLRPTPGLRALPALAERVRSAGVPVELEVKGAPRDLPPLVELAAYRVVQEAITNAMKHAQGAQVHITVAHEPRQLTVEVTDGGGGAGPSAGTGGGHGLIGLRERVALHGGSLDAGRLPSGGFRVRAVLPVVPAAV